MECSKSTAVSLMFLLLFQAARSASLTPELQKATRASVFEVVLKKFESDPLKYEKPPPLDLIPFLIRNDAYWSIGTAFALSPDTYASAAHVLIGAINNQFGVPSLRDTEGHIYPIDRILKFSHDEDYVVFTVARAPSARPLPTITAHRIDDAVFAVGNALGEGIVMRDGLLTSETAEEQDGRWKWLRFSAAASPGNSGGPLLDVEGRVIGIVRAKSPNENLNFAVPIELTLKGGNEARFDMRYTIRLPTARATEVSTLKARFDLPLPWADFSQRYRDTLRTATHRDFERLNTALADAPFPKGNSTKMLAVVYNSPLPGFVQQTPSDEWDVVAAGETQEQTLPGHGLVSTGSSLGVALFRVRRPLGATDISFYKDPTAIMDLVLRGAKLSRPVGDQAIRIASLGRPSQTERYIDHYGRRWTVTVWPLSYVDSQVLSYWMPTPEGVVGMMQLIPSSRLDSAREWFNSFADSFYTNLTGTLAQWQTFLAHEELRPAALEHLKFDFDGHHTLHYGSGRFDIKLTAETLPLTPESELEAHMAYLMEGDHAVWDVGAVYVYSDADRKTYAGVERHGKPRDDSSKELFDAWTQMRAQGPGFNGMAGHDEDYKQYWIHQAVSAPVPSGPGIDPKANVLYDIFYSTQRSSFPMDLEENERRLLRSTHILER